MVRYVAATCHAPSVPCCHVPVPLLRAGSQEQCCCPQVHKALRTERGQNLESQQVFLFNGLLYLCCICASVSKKQGKGVIKSPLFEKQGIYRRNLRFGLLLRVSDVVQSRGIAQHGACPTLLRTALVAFGVSLLSSAGASHRNTPWT